MALQMEFNGKGLRAPESYWKILNTNIDHSAKSGTITIAGYYNKEARDDDLFGNILEQKVVGIDEDMYNAQLKNPTPILESAYEIAKQNDLFSIAQDV